MFDSWCRKVQCGVLRFGVVVGAFSVLCFGTWLGEVLWQVLPWLRYGLVRSPVLNSELLPVYTSAQTSGYLYFLFEFSKKSFARGRTAFAESSASTHASPKNICKTVARGLWGYGTEPVPPSGPATTPAQHLAPVNWLCLGPLRFELSTYHGNSDLFSSTTASDQCHIEVDCIDR